MTDMKRIAAVAILVLALSGCAVTGQGAQPGTAAVFDGNTVTDAEVAAWSTALNGLSYSAYPGQVLTLLLLQPTIDEAAADGGILVTDEQVAKEAQFWAAYNQGDIPPVSEDMIALVRTVRSLAQLVYTEEGSAALLEAFAAMETGVEASPQYGDFSSDSLIQSIVTQAQAQEDSSAELGDVSYLVFKGINAFDPIAQADWMVEEDGATLAVN